MVADSGKLATETRVVATVFVVAVTATGAAKTIGTVAVAVAGTAGEVGVIRSAADAAGPCSAAPAC